MNAWLARWRGGALSGPLFDGAEDGLAWLGPLAKVRRVNAVMHRLTGATIGEDGFLGIEPPEAGDAAAALRRCVAFRAAARTVSGLPVRLHLAPVADGALLRLVDLGAEAALRAELAQARRLQAVGQLAGGIAHDFNNLLAAILAATEALRGPVAAAPELDIIAGAVDRGAGLVRQLLAFGRQQTLQPRVLAVNDAVAGACRLVERLLGGRIALRQALEQPGRAIRADPTQLDQVLLNLAINARDAMPEGGTLTLATGHVTLLEALPGGEEPIPPGRYVTITVADTGIGIAPEILPRIFEPFFTTRRESGGTGLGLATVHGIVRQSGGYLRVESEMGAGTRFTLYLPRHAAIAPPAPVPEAAELACPPPDRPILLVEDEAPLRRLAARALAREGFAVLAAGSAEEALAEHAEVRLGCVVSDVMMPGLDGPSLVRALRRRAPGLPAVLISGYAEDRLRRDLAAESVRFLAKPFTMAALIGEVARARQTQMFDICS